jgi:hypothetical protein
MRKSITICAITGICSMVALFTAATTALAQAGSTGGTIGKTGKSASGGEEPHRGRKARGPTAQAHAVREHPSGPVCSKVAGKWDSWASGIFGRSDTTFNEDGTWRHASGIGGKWWCEGGEFRIQHSEPGSRVERYRYDGKQIISIDPDSSGRATFSRE